MSDNPLTRRQQIAQLLRGGQFNVFDIARQVRAPAKSVLADLQHVRQGLKPGERWFVLDASCLGCGFVFRGRERLDSPSRCPRCKGEQIEEARFGITGE